MLTTDTFLFGRYIPFFYGRSAVFLDLAFAFGKLSAVIFNFAVFPERFITFSLMQNVKLRERKDEADIFCDDEADIVS